MGCDIHMYVQYRKKDFDPKWDHWSEFGGRINPGRDYGMFGILSQGVRFDAPEGKSHEPKGLPEGDLGWDAERDAHLYIREKTESYEEGTCTLEDAIRWRGKIKYDKDGKPWKTIHPDWHSFSWLTLNELAQAYRWYTSIFKGYKIGIEYKALLAAMRALENKGENDVRVVFWFDN